MAQRTSISKATHPTLPSPEPDGLITVPRGLKGVVVSDTTIGDVRGKEGFYHYRQYSAIELAERRSLEDVWALVVDGALPTTASGSRAFRAAIGRQRVLSPRVQAVLPELVGAATPSGAAFEPLAVLRSALSLWGAERGLRPILDIDHTTLRDDALALCAAVPVLLAAILRIHEGLEPIPADPDLGHAADWLRLLTGTSPTPEAARAVEQYLISTIDHGFNASTFAARVVAGTGADLGVVHRRRGRSVVRTAPRRRAQPGPRRPRRNRLARSRGCLAAPEARRRRRR